MGLGLALGVGEGEVDGVGEGEDDGVGDGLGSVDSRQKPILTVAVPVSPNEGISTVFVSES